MIGVLIFHYRSGWLMNQFCHRCFWSETLGKFEKHQSLTCYSRCFPTTDGSDRCLKSCATMRYISSQGPPRLRRTNRRGCQVSSFVVSEGLEAAKKKVVPLQASKCQRDFVCSFLFNDIWDMYGYVGTMIASDIQCSKIELKHVETMNQMMWANLGKSS